MSNNLNDGWCPFATRRALTHPNYYTGRLNFRVRAVVMHIADGNLGGVFPTFNNPTGESSAHFCVGKKGEIEQYVSITNSAWAVGIRWENGQWFTGSGRVTHPTWPDLIVGVNPNYYTISVEHEGKPDDVWTDKMYQANTRLLTWIAQQTNSVYVPHHTLIGHNEIDSADRPNCPGPHVEYERVAVDANSQLVDPQVATVALVAAQSLNWLPVFTDGALYKYARTHALGYPQTDEFEFSVQAQSYKGQVFSNGIAYVWTRNFNQVFSVPKPNASAPLPVDPLAAAAISAAQQRTWMPINTMSGLYAFAQANQLGFPQTDEFPFSVGADNYRGQVYAGGIVAVKVGDWNNLKLVHKP